MNLRDIMPKTLFWRVLMILLSTLALLQFTAIWIFFDRHWEDITERLSSLAAGDIAYVMHRLESTEPPERDIVLKEVQQYLNMRAEFTEQARLSDIALRESQFYQDAPLELLQIAIDNRIENAFLINSYEKVIEVIIETNEGLLLLSFSKKRIFSSTIYVFLFVTFLSLVLLIFFAVMMLRKQIRPILRLTKKVDAFGKGQDDEVELVEPQGADEIRLATRAFNRMQERIRRQIRQRTDMLAGVSHDLRTPITRMKLQVALLPKNKESARLHDDLQNMEAMIESYLTFAEGEGTEISVQKNLAELITTTVNYWREESGETRIDLTIVKPAELPIKAHAFRRCLDNLLGNALRYGKHVQVTLDKTAELATITIDDDGPGIPEDKRDQVFRPFYRLEKSRSQETGGYGLGLAIARDIARVHGGDVQLETSPQNGLRAVISLPL